MIRSKKALSAVVATVLLILLTVIAATVIGGFLVPFVKDNLKKSTECVKYDTYFTFDESFSQTNCYKKNADTSSNTFFSLRAKNDKALSSEVGGFNIVLYASADESVQLQSAVGDKRIVTLTLDSKGSSSPQFKKYDGTPLAATSFPGAGNVASYTFSQTAPAIVYARAEVYPILKSGRVCEKPSGQTQVPVCPL